MISCELSFVLHFLVNVSSIYANLKSIPVFNGTNFGKWKKHIIIVLGCMDLDHAIRVEQPPTLIEDSITKQEAIFENCECLNHISLMIMKHSILDPLEVQCLKKKMLRNS